MTREIARIVGGILSSNRMFSVGDGEVWIPLSDDVFDVARHVEQALTLYGYEANSTRSRAYCGTRIEVDKAESVTHHQLQKALQETYGYKGRVAGLSTEGQLFEMKPIEPGNILEIPRIGWTGDDCRVVIGHYDGTYLAKLHTPDVEIYKGNSSLKIVRGKNSGDDITLRRLIDRKEVIVKRREWSGYPQQAYP